MEFSPVLLWHIGEKEGRSKGQVASIVQCSHSQGFLECIDHLKSFASKFCGSLDSLTLLYMLACVSLRSYDHFVTPRVQKRVYFSWLTIGFNDIKVHLSEILAVLNLTQLEESGYLLGMPYAVAHQNLAPPLLPDLSSHFTLSIAQRFTLGCEFPKFTSVADF